VQIFVRHAGNTLHIERKRARVRRCRNGVTPLKVHVRAARQAGRAGRLRSPVTNCQLDAGGHGCPRPSVVPRHVARRPTDTHDVQPTARQRIGVRAHRTGPMVQRQGPRPPVARVPAQHGVRQHASLGGTGSADGTQRP